MLGRCFDSSAAFPGDAWVAVGESGDGDDTENEILRPNPVDCVRAAMIALRVASVMVRMDEEPWLAPLTDGGVSGAAENEMA